MFTAQRTVKLVVHVLSVFHSFFVEAFLFQFLLCVKRAVSTVQFAGFLGFLIRYPTYIVIHPAGSVLPPSLLELLAFNLL